MFGFQYVPLFHLSCYRSSLCFAVFLSFSLLLSSFSTTTTTVLLFWSRDPVTPLFYLELRLASTCLYFAFYHLVLFRFLFCKVALFHAC